MYFSYPLILEEIFSALFTIDNDVCCGFVTYSLYMLRLSPVMHTFCSFYFNCKIIVLLWYVGFCHKTTWIKHEYTYQLFFEPPPTLYFTTSLGHYRSPGWFTVLCYSNFPLAIYMLVYVFQCYSPQLFLPFLFLLFHKFVLCVFSSFFLFVYLFFIFYIKAVLNLLKALLYLLRWLCGFYSIIFSSSV